MIISQIALPSPSTKFHVKKTRNLYKIFSPIFYTSFGIFSPQTVNHSAMYSAVSHLVPGGSLMSRGGGVVSSQLSPNTRDQLYHHQLAVNELLRHFWACFPILNPQLEEKVFVLFKIPAGLYTTLILLGENYYCWCEG